MASTHKRIRSVLEARLNSTPNIPVIAWENVSYEPSTNTPFIKPMFQPVLREQASMAQTPPHFYRGLFTILCHQPEGIGPGASETLADTLVERFDTNTNLVDGDLVVSIRAAQQESSYTNSPWFITPVTVRWYTYYT